MYNLIIFISKTEGGCQWNRKTLLPIFFKIPRGYSFQSQTISYLYLLLVNYSRTKSHYFQVNRMLYSRVYIHQFYLQTCIESRYFLNCGFYVMTDIAVPFLQTTFLRKKLVIANLPCYIFLPFFFWHGIDVVNAGLGWNFI